MVKELFEKRPEELISYETQSERPIISSKSKEIEKLMKSSSTAKNFENWLKSRIKIAITNNDKETELMLTEILNKYKSFGKDKEYIVTIELENWKGKDKIDIYQGVTDNFVILEHRKSKETGEVSTIKHEVEHSNLNRMIFFIKKWKIGETKRCYDFAEVLNEKNWEEIWKKRTKVYFKQYYYPLKVMEKLKLIKYSGRGEITRLK